MGTKRKNRFVSASSGCPQGDYMNPAQLEWFRARLLDMLKACREELRGLRSEKSGFDSSGDEADAAAAREIDFRDAAKAALISARCEEIEAALRRIDSGEYGWCEETGEPIGLQRMIANPLSRFSLEAQARREAMSRLSKSH
ncbi:RNA polymerase-binding protein DksA [Pelomicrobium methylotrophicum]|uniref:RNA polymerase-binding protein DksA n=2 Tax=Pelomicrobium methylotrophicum TaxID=2602750 RepID=A0A5C7ETN5_9PROT|nr:RNA polymerase-binding protein DksA [Pelomicrobium methylotrophicum]